MPARCTHPEAAQAMPVRPQILEVPVATPQKNCGRTSGQPGRVSRFHHAAAGIRGLRLRGAQGPSRLGLAGEAGRPCTVGGLHFLGSDPAGVHVHGRRGDAVRPGTTEGAGRKHLACSSTCVACVHADRAQQYLFELGTRERLKLQFINVLCQIAFGYMICFLIMRMRFR